MSMSVRCLNCGRYEIAGTCEAFPDGIPTEICLGGVDHSKPYEGDHGLQFIPRPVGVGAAVESPKGG